MRHILVISLLASCACSSKSAPSESSPTEPRAPTAPVPVPADAAPAPVPADAAPPDAAPPDAAPPTPVSSSVRKTVLRARVIGLIPVTDAALKRKWRKATLESMLLKLADSKFAAITVTETPCMEGGECALVYLDPCATYPTGEDCEGFFMSVIVRLNGSRVTLDHMISPTNEPAATLEDIEMYADMAP